VTADNVSQIPRLVGELYKIVRTLNELFPERPFTPDGHLVGSLGEVVAAFLYGLKLERCSTAGFDARTATGQTVEIKLTGGESVAIASELEKIPDFLLVFRLNPKEGFEEVYNGPFPRELYLQMKPSSRRTVQMRIRALRRINPVPRALTFVHQLTEFNRLFEQPLAAHPAPIRQA
jgi:hypothetical protein